MAAAPELVAEAEPPWKPAPEPDEPAELPELPVADALLPAIEVAEPEPERVAMLIVVLRGRAVPVPMLEPGAVPIGTTAVVVVRLLLRVMLLRCIVSKLCLLD